MGAFTRSIRARADLLDIAEYTLQTWGERQVNAYLGDLETCCRRLAENPGLGRQCVEIRPDLRRFEHREHVVFYIARAEGPYIVRILHRSMLPHRHSFL